MTERRARSEWEEIIRDYCRRQDEFARHADFCKSMALPLKAFRVWLYRLSSGSESDGRRVFRASQEPKSVAASKPLVTETRRCAPRIILNARDAEMLRSIAHDRAVPIDVVARRFFKTEKTALTRLRQLQRSAYVTLVGREGGVVSLTPKGARAVGASMPRRMHPRHLAHHVQTLRAIEALKAHVGERGGEFIPFENREGRAQPYRLEIHVQAEERRSRGTTRGMDYDAAPDGVVQVRWADGSIQTVAVEYYTRSYSDAQMEAKAELFRNYDAVHQVSDNERTAERVRWATGHPCHVLYAEGAAS